MPSSSDDVATMRRQLPALEPLLDPQPLLAGHRAVVGLAISSPASSLIAAASRSASRRLLTKIIVERCARISSTSRGWIAGQIDRRGAAPCGGRPAR